MPTSLPAPLAVGALSTTGTPEMRWRSISASASASVASGAMVTGLTTMPLSYCFTRRTCSACSSIAEVLVDHAHAAGLGHGDGEARFGDGVHGGGNQRNAQLDRLGEPRSGIDLSGKDFGGAGHQQHIVEGQGFADGRWWS